VPLLRFPGKASELTTGLGNVLSTTQGYELDTDGPDLIVTSIPPKQDIITISNEHSLSSVPFSDIADFYTARLNPDVERFLNYDEPPVRVFGGFGLCTDFQKIRLDLYLTRPDGIRNQLITQTLPFMKDTLGANKVRALYADVIGHQKLLTLAKFIALFMSHDMSEVSSLTQEHEVMRDSLPNGIDIIEYFDSMLWIPPMSVSLPQQRFGSGLYFFKEHPWAFPFEGQAGISEMAFNVLSPLNDGSNETLIAHDFFSPYICKKYFEMLAHGLNRLTAYIYDPRIYIDENKVPDYHRMLQVICSTRLLFSDLMAINSTLLKYQRLRLSFAFIDKFSNMLPNINDTKDFKGCFSNKFKDELISIVRFNVSRSHSDQLANKMINLIRTTYDNLHSKIMSMAIDAEHLSSEDDRLTFIRTLRNSQHGMILHHDQFNDVFFSTKGGIPSEIIMIPLLISWGMILAPDRIFFFNSNQAT